MSWAWDAGSSNTTIAAGGLNSSVYDQTRTWSGDWTGGFYNASHNATKIFDGSLSTYASVTFPVSAGVTLTVSPAITGSTIRVYYSRSSSSTPCLVNGTETLPSTGAAQTFQWYTLTATSISSFKLTHDFSGESYLAAIEVDGKMLVDSGVTPATNVPSIASTVRANPSAGFSIVSYTGNGSASQTIAHGLNAAPKMIHVKKTDGSYDWISTHDVNGSIKRGYLNLTLSFGNESVTYDSNTFMPVNSGGDNGSGGSFIAYCFAPVEGYSSMGTYLGNGSANGPFVFTGMRPAFILTKGVDDAEDWYIRDTARSPHNEVDESLRPNDSGSEYSGRTIDILSNGFKITDSDSQINESGKTYLYYAAAEHPFKTARAR